MSKVKMIIATHAELNDAITLWRKEEAEEKGLYSMKVSRAQAQQLVGGVGDAMYIEYYLKQIRKESK